MKRRLTPPAASLACANSGCTNSVERRSCGRQRRFCSDDCRVRAHRISLQGPPKLAPDDTQATPEDLNAPAPVSSISLQAKSKTYEPRYAGLSDGIVGPREVIRAEVINGRDWQEIISSSGVRSYVSRIAKPALNVMQKLRDGHAVAIKGVQT
jgi:hypothetical protein